MVALMSVSVSPRAPGRPDTKVRARAAGGRAVPRSLRGVLPAGTRPSAHRGTRQRVLPRRGMRALLAVSGGVLFGIGGVHEPGIHADGVLRQHRKALAIIGLVLQLAGAGGLGMPVQMLSAPLFRRFTRGCPSPIPCRRWKEPWPASTATSTLCRWACSRPSWCRAHSRPRPAAPRHPAEPVGARQAGRDEVPLAPRRVQAPVDGLKLAKLDETSLAALSSNGQKIRADCFSEALFSFRFPPRSHVRYNGILTW